MCARLSTLLQACREDRQGFLFDLIRTEVLPRIPPDQRDTFLHIGANRWAGRARRAHSCRGRQALPREPCTAHSGRLRCRCHLTRRLASCFESSHVVEPNTYQLPLQEELLEAGLVRAGRGGAGRGGAGRG